jgi:hypothetical protein
VELTDKQLANLLSRLNLPRNDSGRQGVRRHLDIETVRAVDLVAALGRIGVPAAEALSLVGALPAHDSAELWLQDGLGIVYRPGVHRGDLAERLRDAAEVVVPRRRGRPPVRRSGSG